MVIFFTKLMLTEPDGSSLDKHNCYVNNETELCCVKKQDLV